MFFERESQVLDILLRNYLITPDQKKVIDQNKGKQRSVLLKKQHHRRSSDKKPPYPVSPPDIVDVIVSLNLMVQREGKKKALSEEQIMRAVAEDQNLPFKKLDPLELNLEVVTKTIPKNFALKHMILPFAVTNGILEVAICDPDIRHVLEDIEKANQIKVKPYLSTRSDIRKILAEFYGFQSSITAAENHLANPLVDLGNLEQYVRISSSEEIASSDHHIKGAVDHLFSYAFEQHASDIHVEPKRSGCMIRIRIDGVLHTIYKLPRVVHAAIVSRIKTLSRMDIAEKRRPQDGRIKVDHQGKEAEIRVSTVPVAFGEKVVMRILDPDIMFQDLDAIGFSPRDLKVYENFLQSPHGMVLVTGPTGSGKSTTLYSTLKYIATPDKNIITVEDPVEMVYEEFNQIAVQPQVDVTFSTILRNILRQDPDIIMIGEIRDYETASYAVQAAMTGHLLFSTLHTNDAVSSISRLLDLGLQPFMVSSTMLGAMAQRLVRKICTNCETSFTADATTLRNYGLPVEGDGDFHLKKGKGCKQCRGTGYSGRNGVFEIFPMSEKMQQMVCDCDSEAEIRTIARQEGMTSLKEDAWRKVQAGITTYEEAVRVTGIS